MSGYLEEVVWKSGEQMLCVCGGVTFLNKFRHIYTFTHRCRCSCTAHLSSVNVQTQGKGSCGPTVSKASSALQSRTGTLVDNQSTYITSDTLWAGISIHTCLMTWFKGFCFLSCGQPLILPSNVNRIFFFLPTVLKNSAATKTEQSRKNPRLQSGGWWCRVGRDNRLATDSCAAKSVVCL